MELLMNVGGVLMAFYCNRLLDGWMDGLMDGCSIVLWLFLWLLLTCQNMGTN